MTVSTFDIAASADDGWAGAADTNYPPIVSPTTDTTQTVLWVMRGFNSPNYEIYVSLLRWDTSAIPDTDTVTAAALKIMPRSEFTTSDVDGRSVVAEYYEMGSMDVGDWSSTAVADAHTGTTIAALTLDAVNTLTLTNVTSISKTGYTGLRLHISGSTPTNRNYVGLASLDHATAPAPQLEVTHSGAPAPMLNTLVQSTMRSN